eukprot:2538658-Amphidinium_carterae.1
MAMPQSLGPLGGPASDSAQNQSMGDHNEMVVGKRDAIRNRLASTRTAEPTRANAPAVVVVQALETMSSANVPRCFHCSVPNEHSAQSLGGSLTSPTTSFSWNYSPTETTWSWLRVLLQEAGLSPAQYRAVTLPSLRVFASDV